MNRRASNVGLAGLRRQSIIDSKAKRVSLKESSLGVGIGLGRLIALAEVKDGDTYYKTERVYPSIPDHPEDVSISVARWQQTHSRDTRSGSTVSLSRDETTTPENGPTENRDRAASIAQSASDKRPKLVIWPEWNDTDVNAEKWDMAHKGKEKDKGKSPVVSHSFDDPEGKIELPTSVKVDNWKRPQDFITEKTPVIVDPDGMNSFNLIEPNEHLHGSELMRHIISQINALWDISSVKNPPPDQVPGDPGMPYEEVTRNWRPWEHIYGISKVQKGPFVPPYNPYGKYAVRLYWMGCWRKIIIDDTLPFDENDKLMLPATTMQQELWPMLLTKALVKVAALDYTGGNANCEFGDVSIINCLTGWLPEQIPLQGFLSDDQSPFPSPLDAKKKKSLSGRASPLVSAGQVLDKYMSLSHQPPSRENSGLKPVKKIGINDDIRQDVCREDLCFR